MRLHRRPALLGLLALAGCDGCGDEPIARVPVGIALSPVVLRFEPTPIGLERLGAITVSNVGGAPLAGLELRLIANGFAVRGTVPSELAPGASVPVDIAFSPRAPGDAEGAVFASASGVATASASLSALGLPAPDCDDDNPCTADSFGLDTRCAHTPIAGACDDGSACSEREECVDGRCVGSAIDCEPPASCFAGLCDTERGCVFVTAEGACDDRDPCTQDVCTVAGCTNPTAPDGMACGPLEQCVSARICVLGGCIEAAIPEGTPCSDGDVCTEGDACVAQRCTGARAPREAEVLGAAPTFGGAESAAVILGDGRLVVLDPLEDGRGAQLTALEVQGELVTRRSTSRWPDLLANGRASIAATSTRGELVILDGTGGVALFDLDAAGVVHARGSTRALGLATGVGGRAPVVFHAGRVYTCGLGDRRVRVLDVRDRATPRSVRVLEGVGACSSLAIDAARGHLIVGSYDVTGGGGISRYALADPSAPLLVDRAFAGTSVRAATNGALIALGECGVGARSSTVTLVDPRDLSVVRRFDVGAQFFTEEIADLVFAGDRLFVQSKGQLSAWDVGNPRAPEGLFQLERSGVGSGSNAPPPHALATDGRTLWRAAEPVYGPALFLDVRGGLPRPLSHVARGEISRLFRAGSALYALDRHSVRGLDTTDADTPTIAAGTHVTSRASATLWSLGAAARPLVAQGAPGTYTSAYAVEWRDGRDPSAPITLTAPFTPFRPDIWRVADDGRSAASLVLRFAGDRARYVELDLGALTPQSAALPWTPRVELDLAIAPHEERYGTVAFDDDRAIVVVLDPIRDLFDSREVIRSHVFVVDRAAGVVEATHDLDGHVVSVAVDGDRVVAVLKASGGLCCGAFLGEVVRGYRVAGGALVLEGEVPLPASAHVLSLEGRSAIVSTEAGAAFLELSGGAPVILGGVALVQSPTSVSRVGERVWFAGPHGIEAVRGPCP